MIGPYILYLSRSMLKTFIEILNTKNTNLITLLVCMMRMKKSRINRLYNKVIGSIVSPDSLFYEGF